MAVNWLMAPFQGQSQRSRSCYDQRKVSTKLSFLSNCYQINFKFGVQVSCGLPLSWLIFGADRPWPSRVSLQVQNSLIQGQILKSMEPYRLPQWQSTHWWHHFKAKVKGQSHVMVKVECQRKPHFFSSCYHINSKLDVQVAYGLLLSWLIIVADRPWPSWVSLWVENSLLHGQILKSMEPYRVPQCQSTHWQHHFKVKGQDHVMVKLES
jgi:hypothetical protein